MGASVALPDGCEASGSELTHRIEFGDGGIALVCAAHASLYERVGAAIGRPVRVSGGPEPFALLPPAPTVDPPTAR